MTIMIRSVETTDSASRSCIEKEHRNLALLAKRVVTKIYLPVTYATFEGVREDLGL